MSCDSYSKIWSARRQLTLPCFCVNNRNDPAACVPATSERKKVSMWWMFPAIALRRSAVFVCQDTLLAGICDTVLNSIARGNQSYHIIKMTRHPLMKAARTDLPMPDKQPVLYFGTRPAVFLFLRILVSDAVARPFVWFPGKIRQRRLSHGAV